MAASSSSVTASSTAPPASAKASRRRSRRSSRGVPGRSTSPSVQRQEGLARPQGEGRLLARGWPTPSGGPMGSSTGRQPSGPRSSGGGWPAVAATSVARGGVEHEHDRGRVEPRRRVGQERVHALERGGRAPRRGGGGPAARRAATPWPRRRPCPGRRRPRPRSRGGRPPGGRGRTSRRRPPRPPCPGGSGRPPRSRRGPRAPRAGGCAGGSARCRASPRRPARG